MIDLRDCGLDAEAVRKALELAPHPEGGAYREIWRDAPQDGGRGAATSILFLLAAGERSHWHRVDAAELWLWQAGAPVSSHPEQVPEHCPPEQAPDDELLLEELLLLDDELLLLEEPLLDDAPPLEELLLLEEALVLDDEPPPDDVPLVDDELLETPETPPLPRPPVPGPPLLVELSAPPDPFEPPVPTPDDELGPEPEDPWDAELPHAGWAASAPAHASTANKRRCVSRAMTIGRS